MAQMFLHAILMKIAYVTNYKNIGSSFFFCGFFESFAKDQKILLPKQQYTLLLFAHQIYTKKKKKKKKKTAR